MWTSIGANVEEALAGYSRREFAGKMAIASKEAREANYGLRFLTDARVLSGDDGKELLGQSEEWIRMLTSIVKTTRGAGDTQTKTQH
jgi:four helix bundle protein